MSQTAYRREEIAALKAIWNGAEIARSTDTVVVAGEVNSAAAGYCATPKSAASNIAGRVAFWRGVTISE